MVKRIFHIMMGRDGGTERFFLRLTHGLHEAGIAQEFAVRPNQIWLDELAPRGAVHQATYLRRDPVSLIRLWGLHRQIARFAPDVVMAWRAPVARLIPDGPWVKVLRLGDFPFNIKYFPRLDAVIANTPDIITHIRGQGWLGRGDVISNFPPAPKTASGAVVPHTPPAKGGRVVAIGRFVGIKGFDTLIRAMGHAPDAELWLIGDGPLEADLRTWVTPGIAARVHFLGWQSDILPFIQACDMLAMPSRDEALGNVILEAWAAGRPVIATRSQGPLWYGVDGVNMDLVDIDDAPAMGAAIARMGADPARRARLAAEGRKTLAARFSKEAVIEQYLTLFDELSHAKAQP